MIFDDFSMVFDDIPCSVATLDFPFPADFARALVHAEHFRAAASRVLTCALLVAATNPRSGPLVRNPTVGNTELRRTWRATLSVAEVSPEDSGTQAPEDVKMRHGNR